MEFYAKGENWILYHGDLIEICDNFEPESIDLIITDPPYSWQKYEDCFHKLAKVAKYVLKPDGILVFIPGDMDLDKKMAAMSQEGLQYLWIYKVFMEKGPHSRIFFPVRLFMKSKTVLAYGKDIKEAIKRYKRMPNNYSDTFISIREKEEHEWQQSMVMMREIVKHFSVPGDIILDPFVGTGSTGVAALEQKCSFIGVDIDYEMLRKAKERLQQKEEVLKLWQI
ncbi:MAG: site-specific DNA-methyltransferase [Candidatus Bathyarchaeia archaeon]